MTAFYADRIVDRWHRKAVVRSPEFDALGAYQPERDRPDYPPEMVPFWNHPRIERLDSETKQRILTLAWLVYNERTISAEEHIANPAFALVFQSAFAGADSFTIKLAMKQATVDEHFHTLMHVTAIENTRRHRGIAEDFRFPHGLSFRRYQAMAAGLTDAWQRNLLLLTFALVSEVSINAHLDLMARNKQIQTSHAMIAEWHNRDEYSHAALCLDVIKLIAPEFGAQEWAFFKASLGPALDAFVAHDYSAWRYVLDHLGIPDADAILDDCRNQPGDPRLVRDLTGLKRVARELEIIDDLDFTFS